MGLKLEVPVDEMIPERFEATVALPADPAGRLRDLLSSFYTLRDENLALIEQVRSSIDELRRLRHRLRKRQEELSRGDTGLHLRSRYGLTAREVEVARLLAQGRSNAAIAAALNISAHTARHHTQRVLSKLEVHSRAEAGAKIRS